MMQNRMRESVLHKTGCDVTSMNSSGTFVSVCVLAVLHGAKLREAQGEVHTKYGDTLVPLVIVPVTGH